MRGIESLALWACKEISLDKVGTLGINAAMLFTRFIPNPQTIKEKFAAVFMTVMERVGDRLREGPHPRLELAVVERIQERLRRMLRRVTGLLDQIAAGTLRPPRPRQPRERPPRPEGAPRPARAGPRLPTHYGWLCGLAPQYVSWMGRALSNFLRTDPEMAALVAEHPSLAAALRPLMWMIRVDADLIPPPRPRPPRPKRPKRPAPPPKPKPPTSDEDIRPGSLLWSGGKPLAKRFRIRDWDVPRSKDKEAKFLRRVRI